MKDETLLLSGKQQCRFSKFQSDFCYLLPSDTRGHHDSSALRCGLESRLDLEFGAATVGEIRTARVAVGLNPLGRDWRIEFGAATVGIAGTAFVIVGGLHGTNGRQLDVANLGSLGTNSTISSGLCI